MIKVRGLTKDYGARRAVHNLSFDAQQGEIVGFLGPNGAGKTTTMRILTGYMPPTDGEVTVAGYDVVEESLEVRKRVGYLPETVPLYTEMAVFDYLKYMGDLRQIPNVEDRVDEVLEMVGLSDRANGYIANLSKGMRQRVGLAQALLHKPEVLILDEPTIGLDPGQVVEVRELIRAIGKERTVLLSTHLLHEAQNICDRVLIINKGKIIAEDTTENLQSRLAGAERVALRVRGEADKDLIKVIQKVKGVEEAELKADGSVEFEFASGKDARPEVAKQVIQSGYDLLELRPLGMSLEEIFLELTSNEGKKKQ
ncbi:MAG: ATP-binding cassette domain-containing protein [Anaerolineales bacterium]|nr:ATP-binding cassette domain-containing protein [Anaerolineales bacterium]